MASTVVVVAGDPLWQQLLVSFAGTAGALLVAWVVYSRTRRDEAQRLKDVLENERVLRREERAFLAMQAIRAALGALGPVMAKRRSLPGFRDDGPSIPELVQELRHVVHLEHIHLHGEERDACGRLYAVTEVWQKSQPGAEWIQRTEDLNGFLDGMTRYFTARIDGLPGSVPAKPSWAL